MKLLCFLCVFLFLCCASLPAVAADLPWDTNTGSSGESVDGSGHAAQGGGGLIESLFSGAPFTGLSSLDFTVLGLLAAVGIYGFLRSRSVHEDEQQRQQNRPPRHRSNTPNDEDSSEHEEDDVPGPGRNSEAFRRGQQAWDFLSSKPKQQEHGPKPPAPPQAPSDRAPGSASFDLGSDVAKDLPQTPSADAAGFDTQELLQGAKVVYSRMHESIAENDWDDVAQFATSTFLEELKSRVTSRRPVPQVLFVEAAVEQASTQQGSNKADVVFASLLQLGEQQAPQEVREVWRFERGPDTGGTWRISSMQRRK